MKSNICIVSLDNNFTKNVAQEFANATDMFYANIEDMLEYALTDVMQAQAICGEEYVKKIEHNQIKNISNFDNTCICLNYTMLNDDVNYKSIAKKCVIVFIDFSLDTFKDMQVHTITNMHQLDNDNLMFATRKKLLKSYADVVVHYIPGKSNLNKQIADKLYKYYKK